jgi:hypothetical protein
VRDASASAARVHRALHVDREVPEGITKRRPNIGEAREVADALELLAQHDAAQTPGIEHIRLLVDNC